MSHRMHLTTAESVERARGTLKREWLTMEQAGVHGELHLTGGSSLEGLLTKGDIDLHLRLAHDEFASAVGRLTLLYDTARPEIWTDSFAVFERASVGVAATVIDSEHDRRFVRSWDRMRSNPSARERYNALKLAGGDIEAAKSRFFDELAQG